ncbi:eukaryotic translation initiation factor 2 subunit 2-like [Dendronephthya gigantea]|uniref:eukaryotic translation initiation factor 2 subunit 2-like n=1 Tax=Dendronephthya gigantea TaxID=151771 RepID=UPI00106D432F|nr:eukaryotic translation initiation factor 2 subunit 2-like [Dendronephthya gigantea]
MADDFDNVFDPSMKKKKKKVKKIVDLDGPEETAETAKSEEPQINSENTNKENEAVEESQEKDIDDDMNFDDFSSMKKKKKKKKKKGFEDGQEDIEEMAKEPVENGEENGVREDQIEKDQTFDFTGKKKKKKTRTAKENEVVEQVDEEEKEGTQPDYADREYTYEELLTRVFKTMKDKNPDVVAGEKRKFIMRPPQVFKIGTKKTSFANFGDICKILHRQPKHLLAYLLAELGTSGSIDSNNQLIIKGRFQQKQIESVLRRYIKEYVTCHTCRAPETILQKETRLYFLQCETCGSRCSVASIKSGYQAVTGRRAALKSKQQ